MGVLSGVLIALALSEELCAFAHLQERFPTLLATSCPTWEARFDGQVNYLESR